MLAETPEYGIGSAAGYMCAGQSSSESDLSLYFLVTLLSAVQCGLFGCVL